MTGKSQSPRADSRGSGTQCTIRLPRPRDDTFKARCNAEGIRFNEGFNRAVEAWLREWEPSGPA